jgi:hypothetical protein
MSHEFLLISANLTEAFFFCYKVILLEAYTQRESEWVFLKSRFSFPTQLTDRLTSLMITLGHFMVIQLTNDFTAIKIRIFFSPSLQNLTVLFSANKCPPISSLYVSFLNITNTVQTKTSCHRYSFKMFLHGRNDQYFRTRRDTPVQDTTQHTLSFPASWKGNKHDNTFM